MAGHRKGRRWRLVRRTLYAAGIVMAGLVATIWIMYARTRVPPVNAAAQAHASVFLYRDGTTLAQVGRLNRVPVPLDAVPPYVRGAVLAAEDRGYYHDPVISPSGLARATWAAVSGGPRQGGSGIAQQYVKVAYLSPEQTMSRKVRELFIAVKLSRSRSRDWIFGQYLNTVYFGRGAYGIQAASQAYFHKNVGALTPAEGGLLAGMIQAPSYLDPAAGHMAASRARWRYVMNGMMATGVLPRTPLPAFPLVAPAHTEPTYAGQRGYLIERIVGELHARGFDDDQIYRRGLRVTSTIDPRLEASAPSAVRGASGDKDLEAGLATVAPGTGDVLAEYGGRDYLRHQYDNAFLATLPPGSSFDPFVLATGLRKGIGLRSAFAATPFGPVVNDDDASAASASLLTASARSYTTVFARLGARVGASGAGRAGLPRRLPPSRVRAVDQAAAYAALASGRYAAPHVLARVTDQAGRVLLDVRPRTRAAFPPAVRADVTFALELALDSTARGKGSVKQSSLKEGVAQDGAAQDGAAQEGAAQEGAVLPGRPAAGTIGTTERNAAAWFCGYTPDLATAVVVYRASNRPLVNAGDAPHRSSAAVPTRIWRAFMTAAEAGRPVAGFAPPAWGGATLAMAPPSAGGQGGAPPAVPSSGRPLADPSSRRPKPSSAKVTTPSRGTPTGKSSAPPKTPIDGKDPSGDTAGKPH